MEQVTVNGTVMRMDLHGAEVINYGTIMNLQGSNVSVRNVGTIMHGETKIVYRDRYIPNPEAEEENKRLRKELESMKSQLTSANREVKVLRERVRVLEATPKMDERAKQIVERLECALEVNHEQARRIRQLEKGIADKFLREQIDPWDIRPTKEQCARALRIFETFMDCETEETE